VGAVSGSALASRLVHPIGVHGLMLAAVLFLLASLALTIAVRRREKRTKESHASKHHAKGKKGTADAADAPLGETGASLC